VEEGGPDIRRYVGKKSVTYTPALSEPSSMRSLEESVIGVQYVNVDIAQKARVEEGGLHVGEDTS
jgi:hypothetical protein